MNAPNLGTHVNTNEAKNLLLAKDILTQTWWWAPPLKAMEMNQDVISKVEQAFATRHSNTKMKIDVKYKKTHSGWKARITWVSFPGEPNLQDMEETLTPFAHWRHQEAEKIIKQHNIDIEPQALSELVSKTWGTRIGLETVMKEPTPWQLAKWKRKHLANKLSETSQSVRKFTPKM